MPASLYAAGALAGLQIMNARHQAEAIREQSRLTRMINDMNADFLELDAFEMEKYGETQAAFYQSDIDQVVGEQRTVMAAQNIDLNYGTAKELQRETEVNGFLNQLEMRKQARAKALGIRREARNMRLSGAMATSQANINARATETAGLIDAGRTGISAYSRS